MFLLTLCYVMEPTNNILFSANVLTEDQEGETPMIPQKVMQYSINSSEATNVQTTLKVLSSPSQATSAIPGGDSATDPVVRYKIYT